MTADGVVAVGAVEFAGGQLQNVQGVVEDKSQPVGVRPPGQRLQAGKSAALAFGREEASRVAAVAVGQPSGVAAVLPGGRGGCPQASQLAAT